jgi:hypothetical protein
VQSMIITYTMWVLCAQSLPNEGLEKANMQNTEMSAYKRRLVAVN